jgi:hypothetical protein
MKKLLTVAFTMLLAGSLAFAQTTSGDTKTDSTKTSTKTTGKKGSKTSKAHKGGKKGKKSDSTDKTAAPTK